VIVLVGLGIALWLAPLVAAILVAGLGGAAMLLVLPSVFKITVRGPGYQYRDDSSPVVRRRRRD
jgi:hypothetical protein